MPAEGQKNPSAQLRRSAKKGAWAKKCDFPAIQVAPWALEGTSSKVEKGKSISPTTVLTAMTDPHATSGARTPAGLLKARSLAEGKGTGTPSQGTLGCPQVPCYKCHF